MRGWLLQQLIKLAVSEQLTADVVVHADSDVVLLRPFSTSSVVDESGRVRLFERPDEIDARLPDHVRWHRSAEKLLGLEPADLPMPGFISSLVSWRRASALALLEQIERTTGRQWLRALAAAWDVSEYTLYGRFAEDVLGVGDGHFVSTSPLCQDYYKRVPLSAPALETFLDRVGSEQFAVSVTSKAGMKPDEYVEVLERRWAALEAGAEERHSHSGNDHVRGAQAPDTGSSPTRQRRLPVRHRVAWVVAVVLAFGILLLQAGLD